MQAKTAKHVASTEWWIKARAIVRAGWVATPRHARGGRHASPATRGGRKVLARVYGKAVA